MFWAAAAGVFPPHTRCVARENTAVQPPPIALRRVVCRAVDTPTPCGAPRTPLARIVDFWGVRPGSPGPRCGPRRPR